MEAHAECQKLADRFERLAADGLVDVKFFLRNSDEAVAEQVCREINRLYATFDCEEAERLYFDDSHRTE